MGRTGGKRKRGSKKMKKFLVLVFLFAWIGHQAHATQYNPVLPTSSPYPGLTMLSNINSSFQGFLTNNSGGTAPSYGVAGSLFANTSANALEIYNGTSWLFMGQYGAGNWSPLVNGAPLVCTTATGSSNAYVATNSPTIGTLVKGNPYCFITNFANTGSATIKFDANTAITIKKLGSANLAANDLGSGVAVTGIYDGTNFEMTSQIGNAAVGTVTSVTCGTGLSGGTFTSSGTCSFATIGSDNILANATGSTAVPAATTLSSLMDAVFGTTRGSIVERGSSAWGALSGTTTGQVLTWNGAGNDPAYQNVGSALTLLSTVNASAAVSVTFNASLITSTYNFYEIKFDSLQMSAAGAGDALLGLQVSTNNGSTWQTVNYIGTNIAGSNNVPINGLHIFGASTLNGASNVFASGSVDFTNPSNSFFYTNFTWNAVKSDTGQYIGFGAYTPTGAINAIRFIDTSGNGRTITGNFHLYGISGT